MVASLRLLGAALAAALVGAPAFAAPAKQLLPIRICYPSVDGIALHTQIGQVLERTDILARNGLEGVFTPGATVVDCKEAGEFEKVDALFLSGGSTVLLMSARVEPPYAVVTTLGAAARMGYITPAKSAVQSFHDLKGKTLIDYGPVHNAWFKYYDADPSRTNFEIQYLFGAELEQALASGKVDAVHSWSPYIDDLVERGIAREFQHNSFCPVKEQGTPRATMEGERLSPASAFLSRKFIAEQPEAAAKYLASIKEALRFWLTHRELVNGWVAEFWKVPPKLAERVTFELNPEYQPRKDWKDLKLDDREVFERLHRTIDCWAAHRGLQGHRAKLRANAKDDAARRRIPLPEAAIDLETWVDWGPAQRGEALLAKKLAKGKYVEPKVVRAEMHPPTLHARPARPDNGRSP